MVDAQFIFTPENLIENIDKVGAWSSYGLAETALQHYFPEDYNEDGQCIGGINKEVELLYKLGCNYWHDAIVKYQIEVGYDAPNGFNPQAVNEY